MGLKITGVVKRGGTGIPAEILFQIFRDQNAKRDRHSDADVHLRTDDGSFNHEFTDSTGRPRDFEKMILVGQVLENSKIPPVEKVIEAREIEVQFIEPVSWWTELWRRLVHACLVDTRTFAEINADPDAFKQGLFVAAVASVALGVLGGSVGGPMGVLVLTLAIVIALGLWAMLTYVLGTRLFSGVAASFTTFLGPFGFAHGPLLIGAIVLALDASVGGLPGRLLGVLLAIVALWDALAVTVAVRQALDFQRDWRRALISVVIPIIAIGILVWAATR